MDEQSASVDLAVSQPSGRAPDVTTGSDKRFDFVQRELDVGRQMEIHEHIQWRHRKSVAKVLVGQQRGWDLLTLGQTSSVARDRFTEPPDFKIDPAVDQHGGEERRIELGCLPRKSLRRLWRFVGS